MHVCDIVLALVRVASCRCIVICHGLELLGITHDLIEARIERSLEMGMEMVSHGHTHNHARALAPYYAPIRPKRTTFLVMANRPTDHRTTREPTDRPQCKLIKKTTINNCRPRVHRRALTHTHTRVRGISSHR